MSIIQTFYDNLASQYDKLFLDWRETTREQAAILDKLFIQNNFDKSSRILDCACGIGTQTIGIFELGYDVAASDISDEELKEAKKRADKEGFHIRFEKADFCALSETFTEKFDIIIAMDNALPHMLTESALETAVTSISNQIEDGGMFIASIRDYDALLVNKPPYSPPYIYETETGKRVCFQTWDWQGENYKLTQYIINDEQDLKISKFECEYRAVKREELKNLLLKNGFCEAEWKFQSETGFYQPIIIAKKQNKSRA